MLFLSTCLLPLSLPDNTCLSFRSEQNASHSLHLRCNHHCFQSTTCIPLYITKPSTGEVYLYSFICCLNSELLKGKLCDTSLFRLPGIELDMSQCSIVVEWIRTDVDVYVR